MPAAHLWVDTDAGFDDLLAIAALAVHEKRLKLVSTTSGACETSGARAGLAPVVWLCPSLQADGASIPMLQNSAETVLVSKSLSYAGRRRARTASRGSFRDWAATT